ncbi:MAG: nucleotidyltransferase substrate binding protein [Endomicrobium sp.]|nr:nucleotidyltransferase substrate binding protein [Endomicrobium sp.]
MHCTTYLTENDVTRWFKYRDNRNNTAHDYGQEFAQETLNLIEDFLEDVKKLKGMIENG